MALQHVRLPASQAVERWRGSRNLGHQVHHVCIVHKQVAQHIAAAQDETGCHTLEHQAQPDADDGCRHRTMIMLLTSETA
jgi:hypothetical protein